MSDLKIIGYEKQQQEIRLLSQAFLSYHRLGEEHIGFPRGFVLLGEKGTGKSLFLQLLLDQTQAPSFVFTPQRLSFFRFRERLTHLFSKASQQAPAVLTLQDFSFFFNETAWTDSHQPRQSPLTLLCDLLDDVQDYPGVLVVGETDKPFKMPPALVRSGRLDRFLYLGLPTGAERKAMLTAFLQGVPLVLNADLSFLSQKTAGFTPADLQALVQQVSARATLTKRTSLEDSDFLPVITDFRNRKETCVAPRLALKREAYHEAGHWLVAHTLFGFQSDLTLVTGHPTTGEKLYSLFSSALKPKENTSFYPDKDSGDVSDERATLEPIPTRDYFVGVTSSLLAGKAAEEAVFSQASAGDSYDLTKASEILAYLLRTGQFDYETVLLDDESLNTQAAHDRFFAKLISLLTSCQKKAQEVLAARRKDLEALASALLDQIKLSSQEAEALVDDPLAASAKPTGKAD
jgi:SpoVK/Ycf46/Vps4 family AAA+-type ATPase